MRSNKLQSILFFLALIVSTFAFYYGNLMTVVPRQISGGNGNLALIMIPILLFLMLFIIPGWLQIIVDFNIKSRILVAFLPLISLILYFSYKYQTKEYLIHKNFVQKSILNQKDRLANQDYIESVTNGILSPYMNNQFFNLNTFAMYILLTILIAVIYVLLTRFKSTTAITSASK